MCLLYIGFSFLGQGTISIYVNVVEFSSACDIVYFNELEISLGIVITLVIQIFHYYIINKKKQCCCFPDVLHSSL